MTVLNKPIANDDSDLLLRPDRELAARAPKRLDYVARDSILELLSDAELAQVCTAEQGMALAPGDEYLDLEDLDQGVQKAPVAASQVARLLPRSAVSESTWRAILAVVHVIAPARSCTT